MTIYKYRFKMPEIPIVLAAFNGDGLLNRKVLDPVTFKATLTRDLERLPKVFFNVDEETIKKRLENVDGFLNDEEEDDDYDYHQSDLQGGLAKLLSTSRVRQNLENGEAVSASDHSLNFAYINDHNQLCSFDLFWLENHLVIAITENTNGDPEERITSLFIDKFYFPAHSAELKDEGELIHQGNLAEEIANALQSTQVNQLVAPLIESPFNIAAFNNLNQRIQPGKNIDDRDFKLSHLEMLRLFTKHTREGLPYKYTKIFEDIERCKANNDSFNDKTFEELNIDIARRLEKTIRLRHTNPEIRKQLIQMNSLIFARYQIQKHLRNDGSNPEYAIAKIACINEKIGTLYDKVVAINKIEAGKVSSGKSEIISTFAISRKSFANRNMKSLIFGGLALFGAIALGIAGGVLIGTGILSLASIPVLAGAGACAAFFLTSIGFGANIMANETKLNHKMSSHYTNEEDFIKMTKVRLGQLVPEAMIQAKMKQIEAETPRTGFVVQMPVAPAPKDEVRSPVPALPDIANEEEEMGLQLLTGYAESAEFIANRAISQTPALDRIVTLTIPDKHANAQGTPIGHVLSDPIEYDSDNQPIAHGIKYND